MNPRAVNASFLLILATVLLGSCASGTSGPSAEARAVYDEAMDALLRQGALEAQAVLDAKPIEGSASDRALELVGRSRVSSGLGEHDKAFESLHAAVELDPELAEAHYFLSLAYFNGFMAEESLASAVRAVELDPDNADYLYQAAQMHDRTNRVEEAEASWERLLEIDPREPKYLVPLAGLHHRLGDTERAIELLDLAAASGPDSQMGQMARQLAVQLRGEAQANSELQRLETSLKFAPQDPRLHRRRAELLFEAEDFVAAEAAIRNAVSIEPDDAGHQVLLARILDGRGEKEAAAAAMERAVELEPDNVDYTLSLAGFRMQLGNIELARAGLEKVIEMAPDSEQAAFAREQLARLQTP